MRDFRGRGAVVTGAASGIGLGIARSLARAGANVALLDIDEEALARARAEVEGLGARAFAYRLDVSDAQAVARAAEAIEAELGRIHLLFNNAGVDIGSARIEDVSEQDWNWLFGVNVFGVLNGVRQFLPLIRRHGEGGHVVITASAVGFWVVPDFSLGPYAATKYALIALAEALEQDLAGSSIGVSVLCPGAVNTGILDAGRHRPKRFGGAYKRAENESLRAVLAGGMSGDEVGERALRAIRDGELYAFTDEAPRPWLEARFRRVLDAFSNVTSR